MQEIVVIAIVACWIGEWSTLIQKLAWWTWSGLNWFACAKCWGFWLGLYYGGWDMRGLVTAVLCSATAMVLNKLYMRL